MKKREVNFSVGSMVSDCDICGKGPTRFTGMNPKDLVAFDAYFYMVRRDSGKPVVKGRAYDIRADRFPIRTKEDEGLMFACDKCAWKPVKKNGK